MAHTKRMPADVPLPPCANPAAKTALRPDRPVRGTRVPFKRLSTSRTRIDS